MKLNRTIPIAFIILFGVMQVSQLQAYTYRPYNVPESSPSRGLQVCKRAVAGSGQDAEKLRSLSIAKRRWARATKDIYGSGANWNYAANKSQSCRFDSTRALFDCKITASPCYSGAPQNSQ